MMVQIYQKLKENIAIFSAPTDKRSLDEEMNVVSWVTLYGIKIQRLYTNDVKNEYLNHGDRWWYVLWQGKADVSIRSGWFYHDNQRPKSLKSWWTSISRICWGVGATPSQHSTKQRKNSQMRMWLAWRIQSPRPNVCDWLCQRATVTLKVLLVRTTSTRRESHLTDGKEWY